MNGQTGKKAGNRLLSTRDMTTIAILAAAASVLFVLEFTVVAFYKLDFSNLPVLMGTFAMGPLAGTLILGIKSLIGLLHSGTQGVGELADFLVGLAMVLPVGFIYRQNKSRSGALIGMGVGTVVATVVSVLANMYIMIPFYSVVQGVPMDVILGMGQKVIPAIDSAWKFVLLITAPFNFMKWTVISILGMLIYKPLSPLLHGNAHRAAVKKEQAQ